MILRALTAVLLAAGPAAYSQDYSTNDDPRLAQLIEQALERNPAVRQSFARYRAARARIPQAGALPDPMLGFTQYVREPETRVGSQTTALTVSQLFPWFGKLSAREQIAAKEAAIAARQLELRKDEIVRNLKIAYYDLAYVDRAIEITREDLELLELYEELAQARYAQGTGLQQAVVKLQAEITRDQNRLEALTSRRTDAEAALNAILDRPPDSPIPAISLSRPAAVVNYDALYRIGRENRPEVQAAFLQIERDEERIRLARKNYWPDFNIGAGMVNVNALTPPAGMPPPPQNGKNVYSVTVGINIPIQRGKYDAAVVEATEDRIGSRESYRNTVNTVEASVRAVGFRIRTLEDQISLFENTLLPQTQQALESTEAAYSTGTLGVLDLIDSERVLLDVRLGLAQLSSDYTKALAEMERAVGAPFPR